MEDEGVRLSHITIMIVVFTTVSIGMIDAMNSIFIKYELPEYQNSTLVDQYAEIEATAQQLELDAKSGEGLDFEQIFDILNFAFFKLSVTFFTIPNMFGGIVEDVATEDGGLGAFIPDWLIWLILSLISISIAYAVVSIITRRDT